jgi:hypothetical protein
MKPVAYHRLAASELIKSARFYERRNSVLGDAFISAIEKALLRIQCDPELGKPGRLSTKVGKQNDFHFGLFISNRRIGCGLSPSLT